MHDLGRKCSRFLRINLEELTFTNVEIFRQLAQLNKASRLPSVRVTQSLLLPSV